MRPLSLISTELTQIAKRDPHPFDEERLFDIIEELNQHDEARTALIAALVEALSDLTEYTMFDALPRDTRERARAALAAAREETK